MNASLVPCVLGLIALGALRLAAAAAATTDAEVAIAVQAALEDRYPRRETDFGNEVVGYADVVYSALDGYRPLTLDLYRQASQKRAQPLVIFVHGGGWLSGHTRHAGAFENWPQVLAALAAKGYVVASVEYRLSGEARFPAALTDVRAAISWLRMHAAEFGIDRRRVVLWGTSAGAQLAALAAMTCSSTPPAADAASAGTTSDAASADCVQGLISWYGIVDLGAVGRQASAGSLMTPAGIASPPGLYLGCAPAQCDTATLAASNPMTFVDSADPPVLLVHGADDRVVPVQQSREFLARLKAKGVTAELIELPEIDHSFVGKSPGATRAASLTALRESFAFINRVSAANQ